MATKSNRPNHDEDEDEIDGPEIEVDDEIIDASTDAEIEDLFGPRDLTIDDWDEETYFTLKADDMPVPIGGVDTYPYKGKRVHVSRMMPQVIQLIPGQMMIAKKRNDTMRMVELAEKLYVALSRVVLAWDLTDPTDPLHRPLPSPYGNPDAIQVLPNEAVNWLVGKVASGGDKATEKKGSSSTPRTRSAQLTRVR
jgi:hypothetical protein